jgi:hypothetical protein
MRVMAYLSRWPIGPAEWTCSARTSAYSCQEPTQAFRDKTRFVSNRDALGCCFAPVLATNDFASGHDLVRLHGYPLLVSELSASAKVKVRRLSRN